jgi:hypothetical protein
VNATFFWLAFTAALNPMLLGADLPIIENRRTWAMFIPRSTLRQHRHD